MTFEFATAGRIIFGEGSVRKVPGLASASGKHSLLVTGRSRERTGYLASALEAEGISVTRYQVAQEPSTELVREAAHVARNAGCDHVIGVGGGSVIDAGKVVSALMTNAGDLMDYLEVIGGGKTLARQAAPFIAVPTTAGTGAEVTRNAVIESPEHRVKVSMRNHLMIPGYAVVDPELTYELPPDITAVSGLDAMTQLIEAFVSNDSNPLTDAVCREGLRHAGSLRSACEDGRNKAARSDMCIAALLSGMALANARLGAVHGLAGPLGGMYPAPHGALCARLLPFVVEANVNSLRKGMPGHRALERYEEVSRLLTGRSGAEIDDGLDWIVKLCGILNVPPLGDHGVLKKDFDEIISKSGRSSSMKGNPADLADEELRGVLSRAL